MNVIDFFTPVAAAADTAGTAAAQNQGGIFSFLPMLLLLAAFMYFMIIRPQSKRAKDQKNLLNKLQKGDEVLTIGGLLGRIEKVSDNFLQISIAEGVIVNLQKNAIASCVPKGTLKSL